MDQALNQPPADEELKPNQIQEKILHAIRKNPYIDNKGLMDECDLTEDKLQHRLKELHDNGWLDVYREIDVIALGYKLRYRIDVKINPRDLQPHLDDLRNKLMAAKKLPSDNNPQKLLALYIKNLLLQAPGDLLEAEAFERLRQRVIVEDVSILMGDPADLTISVRVKDHEDIFQFVTGLLRPAPGVENTSTSLEAWSVRAGKISHGGDDGQASTQKKRGRFRNSPRLTATK